MRAIGLIAKAVSSQVTPEVADAIGASLVNAARAGNPDAIRELLTVLVNDSTEGCEHAPESRRNITTMGGGDLQELCACGSRFVNGSEVI